MLACQGESLPVARLVLDSHRYGLGGWAGVSSQPEALVRPLVACCGFLVNFELCFSLLRENRRVLIQLELDGHHILPRDSYAR